MVQGSCNLTRYGLDRRGTSLPGMCFLWALDPSSLSVTLSPPLLCPPLPYPRVRPSSLDFCPNLSRSNVDDRPLPFSIRTCMPRGSAGTRRRGPKTLSTPGFGTIFSAVDDTGSTAPFNLQVTFLGPRALVGTAVLL